MKKWANYLKNRPQILNNVKEMRFLAQKLCLITYLALPLHTIFHQGQKIDVVRHEIIVDKVKI